MANNLVMTFKSGKNRNKNAWLKNKLKSKTSIYLKKQIKENITYKLPDL